MNVAAEEMMLSALKAERIEDFLELFFPPTWGGIAARIVESGAEIAREMCPWAARWSPIAPTVKRGRNELETALKSCLYRAHDCIHQLWGCPLPSIGMGVDDLYEFKRAVMCGEVTVLTLTEFELARYWREVGGVEVRSYLEERNALPMLDGPLAGKTTWQIAQRLDGLLHKKIQPRWVREHEPSRRFVEDYVPMLEADRRNVDHNWALMVRDGWRPVDAPNSRYAPHLDGLELTQWMIEDFRHLMDTDPVVDEPLRDFNRGRRSRIVLPAGWNGAS